MQDILSGNESGLNRLQGVLPHERVDDLQFANLRIIQNPSAFCFGMDAVLLSDFAQIRPHDRVADLGTGTGILPLLLAGREMRGTTFDAFEIQPDMADMARRSIALNGLEDRIRIHCMDAAEAPKALGHAVKSLVVANPPYGSQGSTLLNPDESKRLARHEQGDTLQLFCRAAALLLKNGGRFCVVFPAPRMLELMDAMRAVRIEPKRLRLVYPKAGKAPNLVLLEGMKDARPTLHMLPPLIVYGEDGQPTPELDLIYHREHRTAE